MKRIAASLAVVLFPLAAFAGTARYTGPDDIVVIEHPMIAYSDSSLLLVPLYPSGLPVRFPYVASGPLVSIEAGDFVFDIEFSPQADFPFLSGIDVIFTVFEGHTEFNSHSCDVNWQNARNRFEIRSDGIYQEITSFPRHLRLVRSGTTLRVEYSTNDSPDTMVVLAEHELANNTALNEDTSNLRQSVKVSTSTGVQGGQTTFPVTAITFTGPTVPDVNNGETYPANADVNRDGKYNAQDIQLVVNAVLGLQKKMCLNTELPKRRDREH